MYDWCIGPLNFWYRIEFVPVSPSDINIHGRISAFFRQLDAGVRHLLIFCRITICIHNNLIYDSFDSQESDFALFLFELSIDSYSHIAVSTPIFISEIALLQPWPSQENQLKVITRPFDLTVSRFMRLKCSLYILLKDC